MSFDDEDDDKIIDKIITKQTNRSGNVASQTKDKQMSFHPKELVKGKPTITEEESKSIDELMELRKAQANFRLKNNMQGYSLDEIKPQGNKLLVDTAKVDERRKHDDELIKKMYEEDKKAAKGVKHNIEGKNHVVQER